MEMVKKPIGASASCFLVYIKGDMYTFELHLIKVIISIILDIYAELDIIKDKLSKKIGVC